jgi:hypothetical protein
MKLVSAALALGMTFGLAGAAFADCPGHNTASKDGPVTTASTTVKTGDKG